MSDEGKPTRDLTTRRNESTVPDDEAAALGTGAAALPGKRYELGDVIGLGGMGEVRACFDVHLAREVAMKLVRSDRPASQLEWRFFAEARVQGGLEHPGIVPVHDVGRDAEGRAYFTMKRVRGIGLDVVLERLRYEDPDAMREYTVHRLLTVFAQVCLTVDFAHSRGVVHRDLKPSNVMLGDHGEVYVLDWGIAKVRQPAASDDAGPASAPTRASTLVGTPGYAAPEIATGARGNAQSDVFSLGAILFEIVAREPLLADDDAARKFFGDPGSVERRPRLRANTRDVPAELDAVCYRATSPDPSVRYPSARALHDVIEAFLSGDRDVLLRRKLASEHLARASEMLARALRGHIAPEEMAEALRDAGRAVALAPEDPRTVGVLVRLLTEPPEKLPPEVDEQVLEQSAERLQRAIPTWALIALPLGWATIYPVLLFLRGVRDWFEALVVPVVWCVAGLVMLLDLKARSYSRRGSWISVAAAMAAVASTTVLDGPLMVLPAMTVAVAMGATLRRKARTLPTVLGAVLLIGTAVLAWSGLHDPYHYDHGTLTLRLVQPVTAASLYVGATALHLLTLLVGTRFASRYRKALDEAETRTTLFTWRLGKLLPRQVPRATIGSP
jgi:serine/threonine-protein kinase